MLLGWVIYDHFGSFITMEDPTSQVFRRKNKESFRVHHEGNDEDASQLMNGETQCDCRESCGENLEDVEIRSHNLLQTSRIHPQVHITSISWTTTDKLMTQMLRPRHIASSAKTEWLLRMSKLVSVCRTRSDQQQQSVVYATIYRPINVIKAPQGLTADNCKSTAKWSEHVNHGKWLWPIEYQLRASSTMSWERSPGRAPELTDRLLYAMRQDSYGMAKDSTYTLLDDIGSLHQRKFIVKFQRSSQAMQSFLDDKKGCTACMSLVSRGIRSSTERAEVV
ncbi:uncharacterized protein LACBIDRAFT_328025 [Laccaria bicolor S238N-H82]|uniref:Predicted protein n=1 Tax=Laccaria bicolor (strain S238N-H82 / ATCC MYA-4686) TaxID=486041 RepID=B0DE79_LACBS|nr:uncharacterized protein LACBIDRAFT_328025 [Laccaria bicolor S238N-H82]EDR07218.1 predicted protein [Laccaria bicolor S238N-H82]|eukprot:XP_001882149.1 predicted protein [Laccaria bicolor S238N-H82]